MAEDTRISNIRTNEEIVETAIDEGWGEKWPSEVASDVVAALADAGRLVTPEHDAQVERAERLLRESEADRSFLKARILLQRDALEASEAARAGLEAVIASTRDALKQEQDYDLRIDAALFILAFAGDPVVLREEADRG